LPTEPAGWWRAVSALQWVLAAVMVLGLLWLLAIGVVAWFQLPDLPTPELGRVPVPTAMAVGGAVLGLLLSALARALAGIGARRRTAAARRMLVASAGATADELVVKPVAAELAELAALRQAVARVGGRR
ncbi:MAG: GTP-binding protein HSR1, partial [Acidimicrobiia bacterium]